MTIKITRSQRYAKTDETAVIPNTFMSDIFRVSPFGMHTTQTAMMMKRLKAAEPTIVDGPSSPE